MSSTTANPQGLSTPVPGHPLPATEPREVIELYTPATVGWVGFLCGLPAGFVLAALNYRRMGEGAKAGAHLAGAGGILAALFATSALGPFGGLLNLALLVGGLIYLVRDARTSSADYLTAHPAYDASSGQGFLIGLGVAVTLVVAYFLLVLPLLG